MPTDGTHHAVHSSASRPLVHVAIVSMVVQCALCSESFSSASSSSSSDLWTSQPGASVPSTSYDQGQSRIGIHARASSGGERYRSVRGGPGGLASCSRDSECTLANKSKSTGHCDKSTRKCVCQGPYGGEKCGECLCANNGVCAYSPWSAEWECNCEKHFTGPLCRQCVINYKPKHGECTEGCPLYPKCRPPFGQCIPVGLGWWCDCMSPYSGENCSTCQCKNGGKCKLSGIEGDRLSAHCECPMGRLMGDFCQCPTVLESAECSGHGECILDSHSSDKSGCKCKDGWGDYDNCSTPSCFDNCTVAGGVCEEPWVCKVPGVLPHDAELIAGVVGGVLVGMIAVVVIVFWLRGAQPQQRGRQGSTVFSDVVSDGSRGRLIDSSRLQASVSDYSHSYGAIQGEDSRSGVGGALRAQVENSVDRDYARVPRISKVTERWVISKSELQVGEMFAAGTSSHVFKGLFKGRVVAIKKIPLGLILKSEVRKAEFQREAQILSQVIHPHVVHFHGIAETNLHVLIVTEYCPHSLASLMQLEPWPLHLPRWSELVTTIARQLAEGMAFLHSKDIMHRDLKPENVLLDKDFLPKICDFGVARLMKEGGHQFTMTGQIGTPIYMAPEIIVGNRNRYGQGADVYSFGILMWAMWHRDIPYKNLILTENLDAFQLAQRVSRGLRPTHMEDSGASTQNQSMPLNYARLMDACWQHDPATRPSFAELANSL